MTWLLANILPLISLVFMAAFTIGGLIWRREIKSQLSTSTMQHQIDGEPSLQYLVTELTKKVENMDSRIIADHERVTYLTSNVNHAKRKLDWIEQLLSKWVKAMRDRTHAVRNFFNGLKVRIILIGRGAIDPTYTGADLTFDDDAFGLPPDIPWSSLEGQE